MRAVLCFAIMMHDVLFCASIVLFGVVNVRVFGV